MNTRILTKMALMLALLIICSQLTVPFGPVPLTLQTFAVLMIGLVLPPSYAVMTTIMYLAIGLVGLPVFSGGTGGFGSFLSPSFGFVIGFIPASFTLSYLNQNLKSEKNLKLSMSILISTVILYIIGLSYMYIIFRNVLNIDTGFTHVLQLGFFPFILGDIFKSLLAIIIYKRLKIIL
ncbi:biotin transporter BioY [Aerococcaceae bacterium DSM 111021]|nr:biotin transporter BioY [Aerococcaceae bacterium DSM 111021]